MSKSQQKASLKRKLQRCKKKLEELEGEFFEKGCDECEDIQYRIDDLYNKIDEVERNLEKIST
jgi:chromosome segregation ATPase